MWLKAASMILGLAGAGLVIGTFTSCDTQSANTTVFITPSSAELTRSQSVTLTASGGFDYRWSLEDDTIGVLSSRNGSSVVYTSRHSPNAGNTNTPNNVIVQVVTVVSYIEGASASGTNSPALETSAEAFITHR